jgi:hypothetical protein
MDDFLKRQTFAASPADPGVSLEGLARTFALLISRTLLVFDKAEIALSLHNAAK